MNSATPGVGFPCSPRVAVVDADRRVQQSIAEVLRVAGVDVVGTAGDPRAAMALVNDLRPSMLLVDPRLPDLDAGEAFLRSVMAAHPGMRIVLMGGSPPADSRLAGAAFISKPAPAEEFVAAALAVCRAGPEGGVP
ncbi:MAG TPA: response regulator [candidate division Zixibacteria bacterium]|nr:response regulator [candidate division Zixibacteria bacterium]